MKAAGKVCEGNSLLLNGLSCSAKFLHSKDLDELSSLITVIT